MQLGNGNIAPRKLLNNKCPKAISPLQIHSRKMALEIFFNGKHYEQNFVQENCPL